MFGERSIRAFTTVASTEDLRPLGPAWYLGVRLGFILTEACQACRLNCHCGKNLSDRAALQDSGAVI
ncbi:hypothetical protein N7452_009429 [Penicillium brevicompactum]|uniref:Uncharacterized protein n=1 Tax=Penicillium brevicompactum TaxID=5074 RepID=A0A9W9Q8B5_PENBR|nr:hypothetical protein N7452_009429 [Penicillium brevicompactum]